MVQDRRMIPLFSVNLSPAVDVPLLATLHSGYVTQGPRVAEFESLLAAYLGTKNVLTVNSGTSALHLAYRLANIGPGDEVITTPMTCTATNLPILANGGTIVWADVNKHTGLIDPADVERKITSKTKAIVCVHWGGTPCDLDELNQIGRAYGLPIIEDAAHAFGATYRGSRIGTQSAFTCFSFQAIKHLTTVDGGLLTCHESAAYRRGKLLRWFGIDRETEKRDSRIEEDIIEWGYKFHMNDVTAAIGISQMSRIEHIVNRHRLNAAVYSARLLPDYYQPVYEPDSAYWLYTLLLPDQIRRERFQIYAAEHGVHVSQVHARNDGHTTFRPFRRGPLPGVTHFSARMVCIPVHSNLSHEQIDQVLEMCNSFAKSSYA